MFSLEMTYQVLHTMSDTARLEKQIPAKHFIADSCRLTCVLLICLARKGITPAPHKTI